jgi:hypothetical protein
MTVPDVRNPFEQVAESEWKAAIRVTRLTKIPIGNVCVSGSEGYTARLLQ